MEDAPCPFTMIAVHAVKQARLEDYTVKLVDAWERSVVASWQERGQGLVDPDRRKKCFSIWMECAGYNVEQVDDGSLFMDDLTQAAWLIWCREWEQEEQ